MDRELIREALAAREMEYFEDESGFSLTGFYMSLDTELLGVVSESGGAITLESPFPDSSTISPLGYKIVDDRDL